MFPPPICPDQFRRSAGVIQVAAQVAVAYRREQRAAGFDPGPFALGPPVEVWREALGMFGHARRFQARLDWCAESVPLFWEPCRPSESPYGEPWRLRMA